MPEQKKTPVAPIAVIVVLLVVIVAAYVVLYKTDMTVALKFRAYRYSRAIQNPNASRGEYAKKMQDEIPPEIAVHHAVKLLKAEDYVSRRQALNIIYHFRTFDAAVDAAVDVVEYLHREDDEQNRVHGLNIFSELRTNKPKSVHKIVPFLDDPSAIVREAASLAMMTVSGEYNPDREASWWKQWWEENGNTPKYKP